MASERDLELLDEYLTNRLNGADKAAFEDQLRSDPELQSEFRLQQQIAEGLRKARASELKQMLNRIPVAPAGGSQIINWAGPGLVAVIGISLYFYLTSPDRQETPLKLQTNENQQVTTTPESTQEQQTVEPITPEVETPASDAKPDAVPAQKSKVTTAAKESPAVADPKKLEVFDPAAEAEADTELNSKAPNTSSQTVTMEAKTTARAVTVDNSNRKYNFHYRMDGDEITLYGNFEKNLYTIMEFNSADKQDVVFMFYKNNYYLLNQSSGEVSKLIPVNDPVLLKRLREQRSAE